MTISSSDSLLQAKIKKTDLAHLDPTERAELVNTFLFAALGIDNPKEAVKHPLFWDILCWALELLSLYSLELEIAGEDEHLKSLMKHLSKYIYSLHYSFPEGQPELGPSREDHRKLWNDRIEGYI